VGLLEEARLALAATTERSGLELQALLCARLAQEPYFGGDVGRIEAMVEAAASIAEELDDAGLRSVALQARTFNLPSDKVEQLPELASSCASWRGEPATRCSRAPVCSTRCRRVSSTAIEKRCS
jgi:hypothetical protein